MALFNFGRKKEAPKAPTCSCSGGCASRESTESDTLGGGEAPKGVLSVKVLGAGCKNCHALLEATKEAVKNMGLDVEVEFVNDMEKIMEYGVMCAPALTVNEKVVSMGKVLKVADVEKLLRKFGG
ncbi:MAG: thioredoxin family protein [Thermoguttaceae bacterium]